MRVTRKGQVTIPQAIRERLGITAHSEVDFVEEGDKVVLVKRGDGRPKRFQHLVGSATVRMSTDEIMGLTRDTKRVRRHFSTVTLISPH